MADYSLVNDQNGNVNGLWLRDPQAARDPELLAALFMKHDLPDELSVAVMTGSYRVVANTLDDAGGCFVVVGSAPAPGEQGGRGTGKKWWQFWK